MKKARNICNIVGFVALLSYYILDLIGTNNYLFTMQVLLAVMAAIAYSVKLKIEIINNDFCDSSAVLIVICIIDIIALL